MWIRGGGRRPPVSCWFLICYAVLWIRIRIRMDPHWFWSPGSGSGSRQAKMTHKRRKKGRNVWFWSAGCPLLRGEDLSCSMDVLHGGLRINIKQFLINKIWIFFTTDVSHRVLKYSTLTIPNSALKGNLRFTILFWANPPLSPISPIRGIVKLVNNTSRVCSKWSNWLLRKKKN